MAYPTNLSGIVWRHMYNTMYGKGGDDAGTARQMTPGSAAGMTRAAATWRHLAAWQAKQRRAIQKAAHQPPAATLPTNENNSRLRDAAAVSVGETCTCVLPATPSRIPFLQAWCIPHRTTALRRTRLHRRRAGRACTHGGRQNRPTLHRRETHPTTHPHPHTTIYPTFRRLRCSFPRHATGIKQTGCGLRLLRDGGRFARAAWTSHAAHARPHHHSLTHALCTHTASACLAGSIALTTSHPLHASCHASLPSITTASASLTSPAKRKQRTFLLHLPPRHSASAFPHALSAPISFRLRSLHL